jgi:hypothetical protein
MRTDRFTLAAITTGAVLAACLAATLLPALTGTPGPLLTWAITYTCGVTGLAKAVHLPAARALCAATMLLGTALYLLLVALRNALNALLPALAHAITAGTALLATKEA